MPLGAVQLDGLRPGRLETALFGTALRGVGLGRDLLPELFVVVGVGIAHVSVDMGREGDPGRPVERRDGVFHDAQFTARQREETNRLDGHLDAVFQHNPHTARQHRAAHVHLAVKALHLRDGRQVERLAVDRRHRPRSRTRRSGPWRNTPGSRSSTTPRGSCRDNRPRRYNCPEASRPSNAPRNWPGRPSRRCPARRATRKRAPAKGRSDPRRGARDRFLHIRRS